MGSRASRLGKNTLYVFIGNLGAKVIGLFMLPFYTRWLSVEDYGITDIITVYVTLLFSIVTCCIGESLFIYPKNALPDEQQRYYSSGTAFLVAMTGLYAILFSCADYVFSISDVSNSFADHIWLIYFMLVSQVVQQVSQQFTRSIDRMEVYSVTGVIYTASTAGFAFFLIPGHGVTGFVWSIILANVTSGLYSFIFSESYKYLELKSINRNYVRKMLQYSVPLIPNGIMWWVVGAMNRPLMEHYLGFHDIGIFAVANKIPNILSMVFTVFITSWQISVLEEFGKDGYDKFYNTVFRLVYILLISVLLTITLSSKLIISIFADSAYNDAWKYVPLLTLGVFFSNISGFAGVNFSATKESKYFFYSSVWGALAAVLSNFILIPIYGLYGSCMSVILSFFIMAISRICYGWKYVRIEKCLHHLFTVGVTSLIIIAYIKEMNVGIISLLTLSFFVLLFFYNKDLYKLIKLKLKK